MPSPSSPAPTEAEIRALVAEVISRLRAGALNAGASGPGASGASPPGAGTAAAASHRSAPAAHQAATAAVPATPLTEQVVTLAVIDRLPAGTARVAIGPRSVITPSARERLADLGIAVDRGQAPGSAPAPARPFVVARVECPGDTAAITARIARAVPGAQQVPATGMADVIAALSVQASRDGARGLVLSGRPATATILANRSRSLRAVTGRDVSGLLAAAAETAANLLVVNPRDLSAGSLERLAVEFNRRADGPPPPDLASAAEGCGCKGH